MIYIVIIACILIGLWIRNLYAKIGMLKKDLLDKELARKIIANSLREKGIKVVQLKKQIKNMSEKAYWQGINKRSSK